jgi:hypothetical protein
VSKAKRNALVLLSVVGVLILLLGMSLPTLVLSPGQPFSLGQSQPQPFGTNGLLPGGSAIVLLFRGLLALGLILFPLYILYSLMTRQGRQRLIADIIALALLFLLASSLQKLSLQDNGQQQQPSGIAAQSTNEGSDLPESIFVADPPTWLVPVVIVIGSILTVVIIFVAIQLFRRSPKPKIHWMISLKRRKMRLRL